MGTQKSQGQVLATSSRQRLPRFGLRSRRKKEGVIQGKLRIRSIPGAFLVLGMVVVLVGTALAVAGYWPYRVQHSAVGAMGDGLSASQASGWSLGAKGLFSTASLIHSERMKLLGPVIMGVGLFILICANTVLYENRDRETQMLLAQMRSVICSVSTAVPSADLTQLNSLARQYQWVRIVLFDKNVFKTENMIHSLGQFSLAVIKEYICYCGKCSVCFQDLIHSVFEKEKQYEGQFVLY
uniref:Transmembrane protein 200B n=1 Tax=Electrophorus electricus TaxID=8005 RepID=A0A4W4EYG8_ELEEL